MNRYEKTACKIVFDFWLSHNSELEIPESERYNFRLFWNRFINACLHSSSAMAIPTWLKNLKGEVAKSLPSSLPQGRTVFTTASMTEPKMLGKFKKYAFQATTGDGHVINFSVSPTLLERIMRLIEEGSANIAITKQGEGLQTNYVVEKA